MWFEAEKYNIEHPNFPHTKLIIIPHQNDQQTLNQSLRQGPAIVI